MYEFRRKRQTQGAFYASGKACVMTYALHEFLEPGPCGLYEQNNNCTGRRWLRERRNIFIICIYSLF